MSNLAYETDPGAAEVAEADIPAMEQLRPIPRISIQAFCETEGVAKPIERAGEDRRMSKAHLKVHMGGLETAIDFYQTAPTPNLVILESRREPRELIDSLRQLAEVCDATTKVVVIGHYNDVWLYRELIKFGISEYVVAPVSLADIIGVISSIFVNPDAEPLGRTIAFIGAKGGVGSSTMAHNIGWSISTLFKSEVVVADLDLPFGTANINFDQDPAQGMAEAVFSPERIDEVYLDVPHVWNGWTKNTLVQADEIVITATPELANLRNTKNLVDMLKKLRPNDTAPRLVLNMSGMPKRPEITAIDFAEPLGIQPLAVIPFDPLLFGNAANNGRMLGEMDPKNPIVALISEMAHVLTGRSEIKAKKKPGLEALLGRFRNLKK